MLLLKDEARTIEKDLVEDCEGRILRLMRERVKTSVDGWVRLLDIEEGCLFKELERRRRKKLDGWYSSFGRTPKMSLTNETRGSLRELVRNMVRYNEGDFGAGKESGLGIGNDCEVNEEDQKNEDKTRKEEHVQHGGEAEVNE